MQLPDIIKKILLAVGLYFLTTSFVIAQPVILHGPIFGDADYNVNSVACISNFTGTGTNSDFILGFPKSSGSIATSGQAQVLSGTNASVITSQSGPGNEYGYVVAGINDVDDDDLPDFVVGAPDTTNAFVRLSNGNEVTLSGVPGRNCTG